MPMTLRAGSRVLCLLLASLVGGCRKEAPKAPPATPPEVMISRPLQRMVTDCIDATGTTSALESVDIRARVTGWLLSMNYTPRAKVTKDQLLFVIDPKPFQAKLDQAKADLVRSKATLALADFEAKRMKGLREQEVAADVEYAQKAAALEQAKANVAANEAAVAQAQLNLDYTQVQSPIAGTVSRNLVDVGNLVGAGDYTLLTTVVNEETVYAYFDLSELDLIAVVRTRDSRAGSQPVNQKIDFPVFLALADETGYPHQGRLDFVETTVDSRTGTIRARGVFPNPRGIILPGMFVRIRLPISQPKMALMVTERAMGVDQGQHYVLIVNDQKLVEPRRVKVGQIEGGLRVLQEGLSPTDWVIVSGLQRARPGFTVSPQQVPMETAMGVATRPASAASKPTTGSQSPARSGH